MQRSTFKLSVLASSILAVTTLGGCSFLDSESKVDTQEQPVEEIFIDNKVLNVSGSILDAATGLGITDVTKDDIKVTSVGGSVSDDDLESIVNSLVILGDGQVAFIAPNQTFTAHIGVSIKDYVERGIIVDTEGSDEANFTIELVSEDTPPAGTVVVKDRDLSDKVDKDSGIVSDDIIVVALVEAEDVSAGAAEGEKTEIVIPAEVEMKDVEGNAVTGELTITVVHHSAAVAESTDAFPGGFAVVADTSELEDGNTEEDVALVTAGFVSVKIENENGEEVRTFVGDPITITMQISEDTVDDKGIQIQSGNTIPVWSYEEDKGIWTYETEGDVSEGDVDDSLLDVTFTVDHLSYWSLAWFKRDAEICSSSTINVRDIDGSLLTDQIINMRASLDGSESYLYNGTINGSGFATMKNLPVGQDIEFTASIDTKEIFESNTKKEIVEGTCDTPINLTVKEDYKDELPVKYPVTASAKSVCSTDGSVISESVALPVYMNGWYTMGETVYFQEDVEVTALASTTDLIGKATIDGTKVNDGLYSSKKITVAEGANSIEFTIIQECETVVVTGAAAGSSGDQ